MRKWRYNGLRAISAAAFALHSDSSERAHGTFTAGGSGLAVVLVAVSAPDGPMEGLTSSDFEFTTHTLPPGGNGVSIEGCLSDRAGADHELGAAQVPALPPARDIDM
jgi:hypothetical protein